MSRPLLAQLAVRAGRGEIFLARKARRPRLLRADRRAQAAAAPRRAGRHGARARREERLAQQIHHRQRLLPCLTDLEEAGGELFSSWSSSTHLLWPSRRSPDAPRRSRYRLVRAVQQACDADIGMSTRWAWSTATSRRSKVFGPPPAFVKVLGPRIARPASSHRRAASAGQGRPGRPGERASAPTARPSSSTAAGANAR